jgi:hypothetical protein
MKGDINHIVTSMHTGLKMDAQNLFAAFFHVCGAISAKAQRCKHSLGNSGSHGTKSRCIWHLMLSMSKRAAVKSKITNQQSTITNRC